MNDIPRRILAGLYRLMTYTCWMIYTLLNEVNENTHALEKKHQNINSKSNFHCRIGESKGYFNFQNI
jgi:transcription initiation factor IIE alpha subunit